jgi:hypothetical protein
LYRQQSELVGNTREVTRRDINGVAHDLATGRFIEDLPRDWRLTPIVEQHSIAKASELWSLATSGQIEGLVLVDQAAPLGKRGAKRKVKPTDTLDATVVSADSKAVRVVWAGHSFMLGQTKAQAKPGDVVEVKYDGFYECRVIPKFARIVRVRNDLQQKGTEC